MRHHGHIWGIEHTIMPRQDLTGHNDDVANELAPSLRINSVQLIFSFAPNSGFAINLGFIFVELQS